MRSPFGLALDVPRGSGARIKGGVYWEAPPEYVTVFEPPKPIDVTQMGLATLGTRLWEYDGCTNVLDWIGGTSYPTPEAFIDEARTHGVSRRMSNVHKLPVLSERSRLYIVAQVRGVGPAFIVSVPLIGLSVIRSQEVLATLERRVRVPVRWSTI